MICGVRLGGNGKSSDGERGLTYCAQESKMASQSLEASMLGGANR